jgi:hypothetical protein
MSFGVAASSIGTASSKMQLALFALQSLQLLSIRHVNLSVFRAPPVKRASLTHTSGKAVRLLTGLMPLNVLIICPSLHRPRFMSIP